MKCRCVLYCKSGDTRRKDANKISNVTDRRDIRLGLCGVVFMAHTESNLTDSGSNTQHQFQDIVTPQSRDGSVQAAPEIQPMKLTDSLLATGWLNREYRNACMLCSAEAFPVPGAISLPIRCVKFLSTFALTTVMCKQNRTISVTWWNGWLAVGGGISPLRQEKLPRWLTVFRKWSWWIDMSCVPTWGIGVQHMSHVCYLLLWLYG
jgi:hypothetical protein